MKNFSAFMVRIAFIAMFAASPAIVAENLVDEDFSLRFPAALSRFSNYGDVAGLGGASAASPWTSSANPAALCWTDISAPGNTITAVQYNRLEFDNNSRFDVGAASFVLQTDRYGTWCIGAARAESNDSTLYDGLGFSFRTQLIDLSWGTRIRDDTAIGAGVRWTEGSAQNTYMGMTVADADSPGTLIRGGILHQVCTNLLFGLTAEGGRSRDTVDLLDLSTLPPTEMHIRDPMDQLFVRSGLHWTYHGESALYTDLHYGRFENSAGSMEVLRAAAGIEQNILPGTFLRAGALQDLRWQETSWTLGIGFYPTDTLSLDLAWQKDFFPEINPEFGNAQTWAISFSIAL